MSSHRYPWAVVIFACRETLPQLLKTLDAALVSAASCAVIHVLVNGNPALTSALVKVLSGRKTAEDDLANRPKLRIWSIPFGDKANAWNQYIHQIWSGEEIAFFVDGYVRLNADAVDLLGCAVIGNTFAMGGTGVPTVGRSAKALRENMIINTGYHGNFCCLKGQTIREMRDKNIRLPTGLYRTDSLMGAMLSYTLDPSGHAWDDRRIHVHPEASWQIDVAKWWRIQDVRSYLKRYFRQVRGKLENAAIADHFDRRQKQPAELPATAQELVIEWARRCPDDFNRLIQRQRLAGHALKSLQTAPPGPSSGKTAQRVWANESCQSP